MLLNMIFHRKNKGEIQLNKIVRSLLLFLLILTFLSGCKSNEVDANPDVYQYKDSMVGDNSAIGNIINQLPGSEGSIDFELKTKEEPYGIILNYHRKESEQAFKEIVIYRATFLFALVQNVDWITFNFDTDAYTIAKEEIQAWYDKELSDISNKDELIEIIQAHLEDDAKVNQLLYE